MAVDPKDQRIGQLEQALNAMEKERDALRLIVTEKFAGADMYVRPEDAADLAKWAAHPEAVRELLKHEPEIAVGDGAYCPDCDQDAGTAHGSSIDIPPGAIAMAEGSRWRVHCRIAAAWRALGDPRGAADIERAHEEALRENARPAQVAERVRRLALDMGQVFLMFNYDSTIGTHPFGVAPRDVAAGDRFEITTGGLRIEVQAGENLHAGATLQAVSVPATRDQLTSRGYTTSETTLGPALGEWVDASRGNPYVQAGANWSPEFRAQPTIAHEPCHHAVVTQRYTQREVDGPRGVLGPEVIVAVESVCRACGYVIGSPGPSLTPAEMHHARSIQGRVESDARGMEAVHWDAIVEHTHVRRLPLITGDGANQYVDLSD